MRMTRTSACCARLGHLKSLLRLRGRRGGGRAHRPAGWRAGAHGGRRLPCAFWSLSEPRAGFVPRDRVRTADAGGERGCAPQRTD